MKRLLLVLISLMFLVGCQAQTLIRSQQVRTGTLTGLNSGEMGGTGLLSIPYNWGPTGNNRVEVNDTTLHEWVTNIVTENAGPGVDSVRIYDSLQVHRNDIDDKIPLGVGIHVISETGEWRLSKASAGTFEFRKASGNGGLSFVNLSANTGMTFLDASPADAIFTKQNTGDIEFNKTAGSGDILFHNTTTEASSNIQFVRSGTGTGSIMFTKEGSGGGSITFQNTTSGTGSITFFKSSNSDGSIIFTNERSNGNVTVNNSGIITDSTVMNYGRVKKYADNHIGGQDVNSNITSPGSGQDGYVVSWNDGNDEYELVEQGGGINGLIPGLAVDTINIGGWDMDADNTVTLSIGSKIASWNQVISMQAFIINDNQNSLYPLGKANTDFTLAGSLDWVVGTGTVQIQLSRSGGGFFDATTYDDDTINRGFVVILYIEP